MLEHFQLFLTIVFEEWVQKKIKLWVVLLSSWRKTCSLGFGEEKNFWWRKIFFDEEKQSKKKKNMATGLTREEVVKVYNGIRQELQNIAQKVNELEAEKSEHK